jgi:hypothetical protein
MKYLATCTFCILALISVMPAQQVGYVDLASPPPLFTKPQRDERLPAGCSKLGGGFFDGVVDLDDGKKRDIKLEITRLSSGSLSPGSEFEAEVRLTNTGTHTIEIPWNVDPSIREAGPDPDHAYFEVAEFNVRLMDASGTIIWLKPLSGSLFGSQYATGTLRRIAPREWVTTRIKTKLQAEYLDTPALTEGKAQLTAKWKQTRRSWSLKRKECEAWSSTFLYDRYYEQKLMPVVVTIKNNMPREPQAHDPAK